MYMVSIKNNDRTQNSGHAGSGWMGNQVTDIVCPTSEKKWPHCLEELLVLPFMIFHAWVSKQTERERKGKND